MRHPLRCGLAAVVLLSACARHSQLSDTMRPAAASRGCPGDVHIEVTNSRGSLVDIYGMMNGVPQFLATVGSGMLSVPIPRAMYSTWAMVGTRRIPAIGGGVNIRRVCDAP